MRFKHAETDKKRQCSLSNLQCPYCDGDPFTIRFDSTEAQKASPEAKVDETPPHEVEALPYARDIGKFDPPNKKPDERRGKDPDELRGRWGKVGEDFFGEVSWESIGILHWERGQEIYYCVARCPDCQKLLDVFANFTEGRKLSDIWPHLLGRSSEDPHHIKIYDPKSKLSQWFGKTGSVLAFLMLVYLGSIIPNMFPYFQQSVFLFDPFWEENSSTLLLRGMVILALFLSLLLRRRYIQLFRDEESFAILFKIREPRRGLIYWINFAVSRFVGYQKEGRLFTLTQIMVVGGLSSSIILFGAWILARTGILEASTLQNSYVMLAELVFWLIVSYIFGVIAWNMSAVPIYILKGLKKVPMHLNPQGEFRNLRVIERIGAYSALGIFILMATVIALATLPIFVPGFQEPLWVIVWAQFALIVFYSVIAKFALASNKVRTKAIIEVILLILAYVLLRVGIGTSQADGPIVQAVQSLGIITSTSVKPVVELLIFVVPSLYLLWLQVRTVNGEFKEIKEDHKTEELQKLSREIREAIKRKEEAKDHERSEARGILKDLTDIQKAIEDEPADSVYYRRAIKVMERIMELVVAPILVAIFVAYTAGLL